MDRRPFRRNNGRQAIPRRSSAATACTASTAGACHGADLRGGDQGGPNLLRSQLVLNDQNGELILPVVQHGRQNPGMPVMPPLPLPPDDVKAIAAYIHSVAATAQRSGRAAGGPADRAEHRGRRRQGRPGLLRGEVRVMPLGGRHRRASRPASPDPMAAAELLGRRRRRTRRPRWRRRRPSVTATVTDAVGSENRRPARSASTTSSSSWRRLMARRDRSAVTATCRRSRSVIRGKRTEAAADLRGQGHSRRDGLSGDTEMTIKRLIFATSVAAAAA